MMVSVVAYKKIQYFSLNSSKLRSTGIHYITASLKFMKFQVVVSLCIGGYFYATFFLQVH